MKNREDKLIKLLQEYTDFLIKQIEELRKENAHCKSECDKLRVKLAIYEVNNE